MITIEPVVDSLFEIEDYIDEGHWPEWKAKDGSWEEIFKAPNRIKALQKAADIFGFTQRDILMSGVFGRAWSSNIHVSTMVPNKKEVLDYWTKELGKSNDDWAAELYEK